MSTDTSVAHEVHEHDNEQEDWGGAAQPFKVSYGKLMMWYFLLSDAFTFAGFLIAYGALRFSSFTWPVPDYVFSTAPFHIHEYFPGGKAPLIFVTFMSFLLIISSVTMVRAVQEGHRENQKGVVFWMLLTILGGAGFLGCQAWEWNNLIGTEGMTALTNPFAIHEDGGRYATEAELTGAGFQKVTQEVEGHEATYFVPAGMEDMEENRFFLKSDHYGNDLTGTEVEAGDSYLITKSHESHLYETAALVIPEDGTGKGTSIVKEEFGPKAFGALFFGITGFHGFHVFSGVLFLIIIMINALSGLYVDRKNGYEMVEKIGLYWHFVDLVWVFVFLVFYLL